MIAILRRVSKLVFLPVLVFAGTYPALYCGHLWCSCEATLMLRVCLPHAGLKSPIRGPTLHEKSSELFLPYDYHPNM